jgi:hypothetical protein
MDGCTLSVQKEKMTQKIILYGVLLLAITVCSFTESITEDSYSGFAYTKGNTKHVYSEKFTDKFLNGHHTETTTQYFNSNNKLIATRSLNFSKSKFAPDFMTQDLRTGFLEGAEVNGARVRLYYRKSNTSPIEQRTIEVPQPIVVDGGFNQFIKTNWQRITDGQAIVFYFTVSCKLDYYKLRVVKAGSSGKLMTVRIEPDQAVLRWIVTPIIVTYDVATKRIVSYEGKSNIADDSGENFIVKLIYPDKGP